MTISNFWKLKSPGGDLSNPPRYLEIRNSTYYIAFVCVFAVFVRQLTISATIAVQMDSVQERKHIADPEKMMIKVAFIASSSAMGTALSIPFVSLMLNHYETTRPFFIGGVVVSMLSTLAIWKIHFPYFVSFARATQSAANAISVVLATTHIVESVDEKRLGEFLGWLAAMKNLAIFSGPALSGMTREVGNFSTVYEVLICAGLLDIFFRLFMITRPDASRFLPNQAERQTEVIASMASHSTDGLPTTSFPRSKTLSFLERARGLRDRRNRRPCLPNTRLRMPSPPDARVMTLTWGIFLQSSSPYYVGDGKYRHGDSAFVGLYWLAFALPGALGPYIGKLSDRHGPKWLATAGCLILCPSLALFFTVHATGDFDVPGHGRAVLLACLLFSISLGLNLLSTTLTQDLGQWGSLMPNSNKRPKQGKTSGGTFNVIVALGDFAGPLYGASAIFGFGYNGMIGILGAVCGVTAIPVLLFCGGWIGDRKKVAK